MGDIRHGVPLRLARWLRDEIGLTRAIETGTFRGDSAASLATVFEHVWTIELSPELHSSASARFERDPRIRCVRGSSLDLLGDLASESGAPTLYWLDGHWSGGLTAGEDVECPVIGEIMLIDESPSAEESCILIDDARLFFGPPPPPHDRAQWPTFAEVFDCLRSTHPRYVTVVEDVIVAVPPRGQAIVDRYWLERLTADAEERPVRGFARQAHVRRLVAKAAGRARRRDDRRA